MMYELTWLHIDTIVHTHYRWQYVDLKHASLAQIYQMVGLTTIHMKTWFVFPCCLQRECYIEWNVLSLRQSHDGSPTKWCSILAVIIPSMVKTYGNLICMMCIIIRHRNRRQCLNVVCLTRFYNFLNRSSLRYSIVQKLLPKCQLPECHSAHATLLLCCGLSCKQTMELLQDCFLAYDLNLQCSDLFNQFRI